MKDDRFLILTGLSGSGKTVVSRFLEDLGYYCVDNLPAKLIPTLLQLWRRRELAIDRVALVVDIREHGFLTDFPKAWEEIRRTGSARLIFLEASDDTLVKRFGESRRPHPLARRRSVLAGVRLERRRLAGIKNLADEVIDTSQTSIAQLKESLGRRFQRRRRPPLHVLIVSFGYKYGLPLDADLVFDARFLPNPFYVEDLRAKNGKNRRVREFVLGAVESRAYLEEMGRLLRFLLPRVAAEGKSRLVVAVGCTGGKHRSVAVADALKDTLQALKYDIKVEHRDIYK
ncbi:MAG: RNase adapter RapZ [Candidatus Aminicenantes bacterium]|nr:RNase adapter RapZ [Candidatus Aminicenantes bacterium]